MGQGAFMGTTKQSSTSNTTSAFKKTSTFRSNQKPPTEWNILQARKRAKLKQSEYIEMTLILLVY